MLFLQIIIKLSEINTSSCSNKYTPQKQTCGYKQLLTNTPCTHVWIIFYNNFLYLNKKLLFSNSRLHLTRCLVIYLIKDPLLALLVLCRGFDSLCALLNAEMQYLPVDFFIF